ncbi:MAG: serine/threonine-protein kinase [Acidobacteriota bacterium]
MSDDPRNPRSAVEVPTEAFRIHPIGGAEEATTESVEATAGVRPPTPLPEQIGPYRVLELLGEGGMGTVYLAERTAPIKRRVALKLIRASHLDPQRQRRFGAERQAMARLNHPNVAQVYDAGWSTDGQPWIALEYVPGLPITEHCDRLRLPIELRLELFLEVCEGVEHAHQKAILHRDLKPSNVLIADIEGHPTPKIIDFGIAKALDEPLSNESLTQSSLLLGTPSYLSPESIPATRGEVDLDTRSDVYALGVVLFQLLVGEQPFGNEGGQEALERIMAGNTPRPSSYLATLPEPRRVEIAALRSTDSRTQWRRLRQDLDWIVLKAMARERGDRYPSASAFAGDVRRYLAHEPVLAAAPSPGYRTRKFVRRHRGGVIAVGLTLLTLIGGLLARTFEARRANREATRANQEAAAASEVADFMVSLFQFSDPGRGASPDATARQILNRGAARLEGELTGQPRVRAKLLDTVGDVYRTLSLYPQSEPLLRRALALRERELGSASPEVADSLLSLGHLLHDEGRDAEAEPVLERGLAIERRAPRPRTLAPLLVALAGVESNLGHTARVEPLYDEALPLLEQTTGHDSERVSALLNNLGNFYYDQKRWADSERLHRRAVAIKERTLPPDHLYLAQSYNNLSNTLIAEGQFDEALQLQQKALAIKRRALPPDHLEIGVSLHNLGDLAAARHDATGAAAAYTQALEFWDRTGKSEHMFAGYTSQGLAESERDLGHTREAETAYRRAWAIALLRPASHRALLTSVGDSFAAFLRASGRGEEADALAAQMKSLLSTPAPAAPPTAG